MERIISGIYKITYIVDGRVYIGKSSSIYRRWGQYKRVGNYKDGGSHFIKALKKYGLENFKFEILLETFDLNKWERFFIFWYNAQNEKYGFNKAPGGEGGNNNYKNWSNELKKEHSRKISEANYRRTDLKEFPSKYLSSPEVRKKAIETRKRNIASGDFIMWNKGLKGELHPFFGKKHTKESIKKMSDAKLGHIVTEKQKEKQKNEWKERKEKGWTNPSKGITFKNRYKDNPELLEKRIQQTRLARLGKKDSEETRRKKSEANKLKKHGKKVRCVETGEIFENAMSIKRKYHCNIYRIIKNNCLLEGYHWEWVKS